MKPKSIKITYWVLLALLSLFMAADGFGGITMQKAGVDALNHLGYPPYIMPLFGTLKILGIIALWQTKFTGIKEWVFAGMAFTFIGAAHAHCSVNDPLLESVMPVIFLVYLSIVYLFWTKYEKVKNVA